jgi:hypothetical protein
MKHYFNEGKEILNQGRSKKQMESSYIGVTIGVIGMISILGYLIIFG